MGFNADNFIYSIINACFLQWYGKKHINYSTGLQENNGLKKKRPCVKCRESLVIPAFSHKNRDFQTGCF